MHLSSIDKMKFFRDKYLSGQEGAFLKILDLGSMEIGGSYRSIFDEEKWEYTGMDLMPGKNVDIVLSDPYNWLEIKSNSVDVFISGQTFEHIEYFWRTMSEITRVLKPGALCCLIAPSGGPEHRYPVDCWRFYPDGFKALARYAGLEVLEVGTQWESKGYSDGSDGWADTMLVAGKPEIKIDMDKKDHIYKRTIDEDGDNSLKRIIKHIESDTAVLELGPATGYLTEYMKEKLNCSVDCVEISPEMAGVAEKYCRHMLVADLDEIDLKEQLKEETYDCILMTDILEHLKENEKILKSCRMLLKENGKLILSVPNIAHASIIGSLLKGKFEYRDEGLLDQTHIRFFTRKSIADLLEKCRFSIETIETVQKLPEDTEVGDSLIDLSVDLQNAILNRKDSLTYQFIIICKLDYGDALEYSKNDSTEVSAIDLRRSFIMSLNERISKLDSELSYAQKLSHDRMDRVKELEDTLSNAHNELSYAQKLAHDRMDKANELENALSYAQKLAYERFDKVKELENDIKKVKWILKLIKFVTKR